MSLRALKTLLWAVVGAASVAMIARLVHGLGATTALSDLVPWGFWIAFKLGGVALAAGGFVIAATVYVLQLERYRRIARCAVLMAFLGYASFIFSLVLDLGVPWNIWRPIVDWQPRSALFEVAWCVMLYFAVLGLEVAPVVLERTRFQRLYRLLRAATLPLVIVGIGLSTLHQSSLGSLLLLTPQRLHPLWYSPILPILFLVSAMALGLMMVVATVLVSSALYRRAPELDVLGGLGRATPPLLLLYAGLRLGDLAWRGQLGRALDRSWESWLFVAELTLSVLLPGLLLLSRRVRGSRAGLGWCAALAIVGFAMHRANATGFSGAALIHAAYLPNGVELALTAGIVAAAALCFFFFVERFGIFEAPVPEPGAALSGRFAAWLHGPAPLGAFRVHSLAFVGAAALALALLPDGALFGASPRRTPAHRARGGDVLLVDGDRDGEAVSFKHAQHQAALGGVRSCAGCHHQNLPYEQASACASCHRDMFLPTDVFGHDLHVRALGGNASCGRCHRDPDAPRTKRASRSCAGCHADMYPARALRRVRTDPDRMSRAVGYKDALHRSCIGCHRKKAKELELPEMAQCAFCHQPLEPAQLRARRRLRGGR